MPLRFDFSSQSQHVDPSIRSVSAAIEHMIITMGANATAEQLEGNMTARTEIQQTIHGFGYKKLMNLTSSPAQSKIALAFYAGDGIVLKVIPKRFHANTHAMYHLPAIKTAQVTGTDRLKDENFDFLIKLYPWIPKGNVTQQDVETLRDKMSEIGLEFTNGDDAPKNVHKLPDPEGTLIGIDSNMFQLAKCDQVVDENLIDEWHNYIHTLYPVYLTLNIPEQTEQTNFNLLSLHDPDTGLRCFDHFLNPEIELSQKSKPTPPKSWWRQIASFGLQ